MQTIYYLYGAHREDDLPTPPLIARFTDQGAVDAAIRDLGHQFVTRFAREPVYTSFYEYKQALQQQLVESGLSKLTSAERVALGLEH